MSGDYSRKTFKSKHNFSGVLMQQGRVQLDADWNEQIAINLRRQRAQTVDTIGRAVVPLETPDGFKLELNAGVLSIFPGRMYIDGLLAENHGASPSEFYAVLSEERGSEPVLYHEQPYFPNVSEIAPLPTSGIAIAYLDVWQREVTHVKQPGMVEPAVGIDTTARWQTVWQVKVLPVQTAVGEELECADQVSAWDELIAPSAGRLSTGIVESQEEENVCLVPTEGGYRALENRLYRVEVHSGGGFDIATFKWSRHNASIETAVHQISGLNLTVAQSQWDPVRSFKIGDWVEVTDDVREFSDVAGELRLVTGVDYAQNIIELESALPLADFPTDVNDTPLPDRHTRIRRWDQKNDIDLIAMGTEGASGAEKFFFGSNTMKVIKSIDQCPVLMVPDEYNFIIPKQIAFPTDFKRSYDDKELKPLMELTRLFNAKIKVLHIKTDKKLNDIQKYNFTTLKERLEGFEYSFHIVPDYTKKAKEINVFIENLKIDLLVMINYKHSLMDNIIKEPVINKIGLQPNVPFLVIPG